MLARCVFGAGAAVLIAALAGCGPEPESGPKITGKILINGQPCRPVSLYDFDLKFMGLEEGPVKKSYMAAVEEDGTFTVHGSIGKGIPPARYKVVILGPVYDANGKPTRKYLGSYTDKNTPLEVEITPDSHELIIDLEKKAAEMR